RSAAEYCRLHCVHSIRVLSDFTKLAAISLFSKTRKGAFPKFIQLSDFDNQFSGVTANLICFIARKNQLNPMKIIQLFSC
ncbi:hypothetical protein, partial [Phaeodactylibacter xiamenensis]|uniref:hypothetical protein n=1 Tax=Phaeodactylibacter xiamenensis TaxID=1524460 RepID=UPI001EE7609A